MAISLKNTARLTEVQRYWELLYVLVQRNLKARYRGSLLGVYWSLLNPLIMTGIYTAIFGDVFSPYYGDSLVDYMLAAFTGLSVIHFFSGSTSQALVSVVGNGVLLNKIKLPVSVFPVAMIASNVFQFCVGMFPLLAIVTLVRSHSLLNVLALMLPFISLVLVCTGIGLFVSALFVFFRDLPYFYELVTFVLWFSSPVFYPKDIIPDAIKPFLTLNPLIDIIDSIRDIALDGRVITIWGYGQNLGGPNLIEVFLSLMYGLLFLLMGWLCFRWWRPRFMDLL
ncbi:ABC transporter permease [Spirulina major CS-329]|uniref:ABC transporter permease n=1 Tax=Spirulina TaxID=1154 RepID=UPI00232F425C|nr:MULTISPECIES: ABC transporter permease [Spirulina]MDB9494327.1 ABC transporter permease [Spirulina subsalsa CS-330]MDB9502317.1 ABC transporter permease [Spirulina major CS-329]